MSTIEMSIKSVEPDSPENSIDHDDTTDKRTSKKRKVLSCYACRSRKMKCDRVYPVCGRCQKTGRADQCSYDPRLLEEAQVQPGQPLTASGSNAIFKAHDSGVSDDCAKEHSSEALRWKICMQERRLEVLEMKLQAISNGNKNNSPSQLRFSPSNDPEIPEEMMFRGKGFKTQFHGTSSVMSMISQYRDLQAFTRATLAADTSMSHVKKDFKEFRDRRKVLMNEKIARTYGTDEEVFALLPPKHEIDGQAVLYFHTWETSYRILHEPTFWQEYNNFWQRRDKQAGFAAILVLIVATMRCSMVKDDVFVGDVSSDRDAASNLIETCEMWLNRQPRKRLTLPYFQLQCLALLAKRANCVKLKQDWLTAGDVMRLALASGMHRDPALLATGRISEYEKEMKKRLWYTIVELEIQSSIDNGLQSALTGLYFDTPAPRNLPDDAFSVETKEMPASRPKEVFTPTSYLITALRTLPLRIHLTKVLNDPSTQLEYTEVLHYDDRMSSASSSVPVWTDSRATIPSALLGLQHLQFLLVLHKPYAKMACLEKRFVYSFTSCIETAGLMIDTHEDLASKGILILNHFRNDVIRVGMTLSQVAALNCARHSVKPTVLPTVHTETHFADPNIHIADMNEPHVPFPNKGGFAPPSTDLYLAMLPRQTLHRTLIKASIEILQHTLQLFERKVMRLGTGYMEYWLLSAAVGMLPPPNPIPQPSSSIARCITDEDEILERCKTALDRFTTLAFRILAMQRDPSNSLALGLADSMNGSSPSDARTPSTTSERRGTILSSRAAGSFGTKGVGAFASNGRIGDMPFLSMSDSGNKGMDALNGSFDPLEDMGVDLSGWTFPDFWTFDLAGDF